MEKMASDGPKEGQEDFFPTNPDLADILGRMDFISSPARPRPDLRYLGTWKSR